MSYGWAARNRLTPLRMVDIGHSYPRFEIDRWHRPNLRNTPRLTARAESFHETRVEYDRWQRRRFPGLIGEWPLTKRLCRPKRQQTRHRPMPRRLAVRLHLKGCYRPLNY